jgi:hypothetical protein
MHEMAMDTGLTGVPNIQRHSLPESSLCFSDLFRDKQHHRIELQ